MRLPRPNAAAFWTAAVLDVVLLVALASVWPGRTSPSDAHGLPAEPPPPPEKKA